MAALPHRHPPPGQSRQHLPGRLLGVHSPHLHRPARRPRLRRQGCLRGVHVPRLHRQAFRRCSSLVSVALPAALVSIGHAAFEGCSSLTSITPLPDGVSIGDCAFVDCPLDDEARSAVLAVNFWAVTRPPTDAQGHAIVPEGLTTIGSWAFSDTCSTLSLGRDFNTTLLSVDFPSSLVSVGDCAFRLPRVCRGVVPLHRGRAGRGPARGGPRREQRHAAVRHAALLQQRARGGEEGARCKPFKLLA